MILSKYLELKPRYRLKTFYSNNRGTKKVKDFQKLCNKIKWFTASFTLLVLNTTKFSNSFHGQSSLRDTIFSELKSGVKLLCWFGNALIDVYFLTSYNIQHRMDNAPSILCPDIDNSLTWSVIAPLASTSSDLLLVLLHWARKKPVLWNSLLSNNGNLNI